VPGVLLALAMCGQSMAEISASHSFFEFDRFFRDLKNREVQVDITRPTTLRVPD